MRNVATIAAVGALVFSLFASGCAHRRSQTTRHLDAGDEVQSGEISLPGTLGVVPRFSYQWVRGFGAGDVDLHVGTDLRSYGGGAGFRLYGGDILHFDVDGMYQLMLGDEVPDVSLMGRTRDDERISDAVYPSVGIGTSVDAGIPVYGEFDVVGRFVGPLNEPNDDYFAVFPTGTLGYQGPIVERTSMQVELTVPIPARMPGFERNPLPSYTVNRGSELAASGTRLAVSWNWR